MPRLQKVSEYEFWHENKVASIFLLENGAKIVGFSQGDSFDLRVLTIGNNPKRKGVGQEALKRLRSKFTEISVSYICKGALPFWVKMKNRGLVDELVSVKDGMDLYLLNQAANEKLKLFTNFKKTKRKIEQQESRSRYWPGANYTHTPLDPEWEYVIGI